MKTELELTHCVESFFRDRLARQKHASSCTIHAYRDALKLFFCFVAERLGKQPQRLRLDDLSRDVVLEFLDHLECARGNTTRTRNARLAAIRSLFAHVATVDPSRLAAASRIMSIPSKKMPKRMIGYLSENEIDALLRVPDRETDHGRRVYLLLLFMLRTGARVSETAGVNREDLRLSAPRQVLIRGKGDKERCVPLSAELAEMLHTFLASAVPRESAAVFLSARGERLTRHGIAHLVRISVEKAAADCPSLRGRKVTPHVLRHTTAMCLLRAGVDLATIRAWLGHCSIVTTHVYVETDLQMKEQALAACNHADVGFVPFKPSDKLLSRLDAL